MDIAKKQQRYQEKLDQITKEHQKMIKQFDIQKAEIQNQEINIDNKW